MNEGLNQSNQKKVLVVEDETPLLRALTDEFTRQGLIALGAANGAEGLAMALKERPDVILLDLVMPEMTGLDVLKKVRGTDAWGSSVPIIILTNLGVSNQLLQEILKNKPSYFLTKSDWKMEDIIKKVKECVGMGQP